MTQTPQWGQIPAELRERAQWLVAGPDKAPLGIDAHGRTYNGSVTDSRTWCSFEAAATYAHAHGLHIGYVISRDDPFCCIDLDWCDAESQTRKGKEIDEDDWSTQLDQDKYYRIIQGFATYTELSTYGKGYHLWLRASIGTGCRHGGMEVYSEARFIVCTGNRLSHTSAIIEERNDLVNAMVTDLRKGSASRDSLAALVEVEPLHSDDHIWQLARNAENKEKFIKLCGGDWKLYGFPSQSEADLALMSMFTFYSASNEQCRRMFRLTMLGQRTKAVKNNKYLNYTLQIIRTRQAAADMTPAKMDLAVQTRDNLIARMNARAVIAEQTPLSSMQHPAQIHPQPLPVSIATLRNDPPSTNGELSFPPGLAGAIAKFIYNSGQRQVKEVAIVGALGLLAGICGKAWHIPQSGLNIYMILIARSGVGKETMHSGISAIMKACMMRSPNILKFIQFNDFVSGPALVKFCATNTCFVNVAGEWGRKLKRLADDNSGDTAIGTLRTVMTNLYQKSGPQSIVGGLNYSNQDNNIDSVSGVAFSLIGETTPSTFYEALTESMMEDGFLSRFNIVEYAGDRPPPNMTPNMVPDQALCDAVSNLALQADQIIGGGTAMGPRNSVLVGRTEAAAHLMWSFERECDEQINLSKDESWRQMWNRAHLKALRIAGLLAVGDNYTHANIEAHHFEWAVDLVRRDIALMKGKIESGDVGTGDNSRQRKMISVIQEYLTKPVADSYKIPPKMHAACIVPRSYLQTRTSRLAAFTKHRMGSTISMDQAIKDMVASGYLHEVDRAKAQSEYNFHGQCYLVMQLPEYKAKE